MVGDADSHDWFDDADHDGWLVVTVTPTEVPPAPGAHVVCDSDTDAAVAPAWVTVIVAVAPPAVTAIVPVRWAPVLVDAETVTIAPLPPDEGETLNHDWFDDADHDG